jgi:hypothetical protein
MTLSRFLFFAPAEQTKAAEAGGKRGSAEGNGVSEKSLDADNPLSYRFIGTLDTIIAILFF